MALDACLYIRVGKRFGFVSPFLSKWPCAPAQGFVSLLIGAVGRRQAAPARLLRGLRSLKLALNTCDRHTPFIYGLGMGEMYIALVTCLRPFRA